MTDVITLDEVPELSEGDIEIVSIDFWKILDAGELLTGTPTVAEQTTSDLTITNKAVNTASLEIKNRSVAVGEAVQFKITGQQSDSTYRVRVTVSSTAGRKFIRDITFTVA